MNTGVDVFPVRSGQVPLITVPGWEQWSWLLHGFSTRQGGVSSEPYDALNLGNHVGDAPERVQENRRLWLTGLQASAYGEVYVQQVHGKRVAVVDQPGPVTAADGVVTNSHGLVLHVMVADCLPLLLVDPQTKAIGAVHAGWRGTVLDIAGEAVRTLQQAFGSDPAEVRVALGPGIGSCCYFVDAPVINAVKQLDVDWQQAVVPTDLEGQWLLDLPLLNALLLIKAGVQPQHISFSNLCTVDRPDLFYSHRRDNSCTGRLLGSIAIKTHKSDK